MKNLLASTALLALIGAPVLAQSVDEATDPFAAPDMSETTTPEINEGTDDMPVFGGDLTDESAETPDDSMAFDEPVEDAPVLGDAPAEVAPVPSDEIIRAEIVDFDGTQIARVDDVIPGPNGDVEAVLVNVGGFLGFGARTVAIPSSDFSIETDENGDVFLRTALTSDDLANMPEHEEML